MTSLNILDGKIVTLFFEALGIRGAAYRPGTLLQAYCDVPSSRNNCTRRDCEADGGKYRACHVCDDEPISLSRFSCNFVLNTKK